MPLLILLILSMDDEEMSSSSKQSKSQGGRGRRSVRFKQHIEIRTYSIVLWCEDGYSIELGNDVLSVDRNGLKNDCSQRRPPHCRSFNERKQLLIDVGGYTEKELKEYLGCPHRRQWRATNAATRDANIRAAATTCFLLLFVVVLPYFYL